MKIRYSDRIYRVTDTGTYLRIGGHRMERKVSGLSRRQFRRENCVGYALKKIKPVFDGYGSALQFGSDGKVTEVSRA